MFIGQVFLESNFGHLSSIQNSLKNSNKEGEFVLYHTYYLTAHKLHSLCQSPYGSHLLLYMFCANCLRTSLPPVLILRVFVIDFPPRLNLIQHKNNIKPEFKTIYCIKLILLFYSLSFLTTQTNCLKFRLRNSGISSLNIFFSSSIL